MQSRRGSEEETKDRGGVMNQLEPQSRITEPQFGLSNSSFDVGTVLIQRIKYHVKKEGGRGVGGRSVGRTVGHVGGRSADRSNSRTVGQTIGWAVGRSVCIINSFIGRTDGRLDGRADGRTVN